MESTETEVGASGANVPEYSVGDIARAVKRTLEGSFGHVRVRGELSKTFAARSGHLYLTMKDADGVLEAVVWKGQRPRLGVEPQEGLEVIATGRLTTFPGRSQYQLIVEALEPAGEGALLKLLEDRRKKLAAEGLFDEARKRPLPFLPEVVGVVTSPQGAVIRDILHRLADRFPRRVLVWPIAVQGERSGEEAARAVAGFNALPEGAVPRPDVIIVARGGGSVEDLWGFNDETLCRTVAASDIPVVSAVGHETDVTLVDFAADLRAPTPTAAAELIVPVRADLQAAIHDVEARLVRLRARMVRDRAERVRALTRALPRPQSLIALKAQAFDRAGEGLERALVRRVERARARFGQATARMVPSALKANLAQARDRLTARAGRVASAVKARASGRRDRFDGLARRLDVRLVTRGADERRRRLGDTIGRLKRAGQAQTRDREVRLASLAAMLRAVSHESVLARGFALVRRADGAVVKSASALCAGDVVRLHFDDDVAPAVIGDAADCGVRAAATARPAVDVRPRPKRGERDKANQSDLFDEGA